MKEFAIRHPFITFLIASDLFVCVQNCVGIVFGKEEAVRRIPSHKAVGDAVDAIDDLGGKVVDIKEALNESDKSDDISE